MSKYILFFTIIFNIFSETLILASFNTLHLGWDGKNYHDTAELLSLFDIIALQEVMKKEGLTNLVKELESVSDEKWSYHLSPYAAGNGEKYNEYYAFIFKDKKVKFVKSIGFYPEKNNEFIREPYGAMFKSNKFDFILVNNHLLFGDEKSDRQKEAKELSKVYSYFQNSDTKENDVFLLGDFNLPAYDESFKDLFKHKDKIFYSIDPSYKTTIGKSSLANSYDNIFYSFNYSKEYTGRNGVYNYTDDYLKKYGSSRFSILRKEISDHLPVYIELENSKDDD